MEFKQSAPFVLAMVVVVTFGIVLVNWLTFRLRSRLLLDRPGDEGLLRFIGTVWQPAREALKWGLILLGAGIGLVIISVVPQGDTNLPLDAGIEFISIAAGFLAYYAVITKKAKHEN